MAAAEIDVGLALGQRVEFNGLCLEHLRQDRPVEIREVQDSDFAGQCGHVLDDGLGPGLADCEIIAGRIVGAHHSRKGLHREGIMLGRNAEVLAPSAGGKKSIVQRLHLRPDLPRIGKQLGAVARGRYAAT